MYEYRPPNLRVLYVIVGIIAALSIFGLFIYYYTEYLWFQSIGYESVFVKYIYYSVGFYIFMFLLFFIIIFINNIVIRKVTEDFLGEPFKIPHLIDLIAAVFLSLIFRPFWSTLLFFVNSADFKIRDPIFNLDASFYVFKLPFVKVVLTAILLAFLLAMIISILVYAYVFRCVKNLEEFKEVFPHVGFLHLAILSLITFISISLFLFVQRYELIYSQHGIISGASYVDVNIRIPAFLLVALSFCIAGFVSLYFISKREVELTVYLLLIVTIIYVILLVLIPFAVQKFVVEPSELSYESKYIQYSINYTLIAYGLQNVNVMQFNFSPTLSYKDVLAARAIMDNVRIWDHRPIRDVFRQLQQIRTYYVIYDVDVDRYHINGSYVQLMIAARELSVDLLPSKARTWLNRHLIYTHGFGIVSAPVNSVSQEGLPEFVIYDIPPKGLIRINRPEIYFGELTKDYVIVNTSQEEFDYPVGNVNYFTHYSGKGGIKLDYLKKLLFSIRFGDINLMLSGYIKDGSRLLMHRQIVERAKTIMPFFKYDKDPYVAVIDGKIYWIIDAYSYLYGFPYSAKVLGHNYMRNPVKVFVDAYNGTIVFYVVQEDAVVRTLRNAFPTLFHYEIPAEFKSHIRYPRDYFEVQANIFAVYHMKDVTAFYNREDVWEIPREKFEDEIIEVEPYYVTLSLDESPEFVLMLPFTPKNRDNLIAWMAARCDKNYGEILLYEFPKGELIYGPMQIDARIDQDAELSKLFTLWGQVGSKVIRGNLLVIPINNSIVYIEPVYLRAVSAKIPELRGVIVVHNNVLKMGSDLYKALKLVFSKEEIEKKEEVKPKEITPEEKIKIIREYYEALIKALKGGKWSKFGEMLEKIGKIVGINVSS